MKMSRSSKWKRIAPLLLTLCLIISPVLPGPRVLAADSESSESVPAEPVLSDDQKRLVQRLGTIRIGYEPDSYPVAGKSGTGKSISGNGSAENSSVTDGKAEGTAGPSGISIDIAELISSGLGLRIKFVPVPDGRSGIQFLRGGAIDVYLSYTEDCSVSADRDIIHSDVYLSDPLVAVVRSGGSDDTAAQSSDEPALSGSGSVVLTAAVDSDHPGEARTVSEVLDSYRLLYCRDADDCLKAVRDEKADVWFTDQFVANYLLKSPYYASLDEQFGYARTLDYCFLSTRDNQALIDVLNAAIAALDPKEVQTIVGQHTRGGNYVLSEKEKLYQNRDEILGASVTVGIVVILLLYVILVQQRYSAEMAQKNRELEEANRARADFLSSMSHDMRTPLNGIRGSLDLMSEQEHDARTEELLTMSRVSADHLLMLIDDILDMAKLKAGRFELRKTYRNASDFAGQVLAVMMPMASRAKLHMNTHTDCAACPEIEIDPERLMQVCINLLSNAVKYTPEGGTIGFTFRTEPQPAVYEAKLILRVQDNGIGMSKEFLERAVEPFTQAPTSDSRNGTGLGLAISAGLVRLMEGNMTISSEPGKGTDIRITIPVKWREETEPAGMVDKSGTGQPGTESERSGTEQPGEETDRPGSERARAECSALTGSASGVASAFGETRKSAKQSGAAGKPAGSSAEGSSDSGSALSLRVLLVEDNAINREIARLQLENFHAVPDAVRTGEEAVEHFLSSPEGWYDVILMDVMLPGMSGIEAAETIRASGRVDAHTVRIAAMSADPYRVEETLHPGTCFDTFLPKPFSTDDLAALLKISG